MTDAAARLGAFTLLKQLSGSGLVESWLAQAPVGGARVLLRRAQAEDLGDARAAFFAEAKRRAAVNHPHVARVLGHGEEDGWCFVASEHIDGVTLQQLLRRLQEKGGVVPPALACRIVIAVGEALGHLCERDASSVH